jgi:hypothetical protein
MRKTATFLALLGLLFAGGDPLYACAVCLTGADGGAAAYDWSVLFLMAMPYLVVAAIAGGLAYVYRRAAANKRNQTDCDTAPLGMAWNGEEKER